MIQTAQPIAEPDRENYAVLRKGQCMLMLEPMEAGRFVGYGPLLLLDVVMSLYSFHEMAQTGQKGNIFVRFLLEDRLIE